MVMATRFSCELTARVNGGSVEILQGGEVEFSVTPEHAASALRLDGDLDLVAVDALMDHLNWAVAAGGPIVLDMTGVTYIDSAGVRALFKAARRMLTTGGCIFLHVDEGVVAKVLEMVAIEHVPNVHIVKHHAQRP